MPENFDKDHQKEEMIENIKSFLSKTVTGDNIAVDYQSHQKKRAKRLLNIKNRLARSLGENHPKVRKITKTLLSYDFHWDNDGIRPPIVVPPAVASPADPVTTAATGIRTFNVGPEQEYPEPDAVPWGSLQAGDVVNIYHRNDPYKWKFGLRGQGTVEHPIIINGVTDANGNRPKFIFNEARTCAGCNPGDENDIFNPSHPEYGESLGGIVIKAGGSDPYGAYKPSHIHIKNLECCSAKGGATYTALNGSEITYERSTGIYVLLGADILIENCLIYDNNNGVFTMAKEDSLAHACERITLRNNRIYGNGRDGSYREHNCYIQCANPIIEGNYIGQLREGAEGASYKSRSSGEAFRYNYVLSSARALDIVYSEDQGDGIVSQPDYGTDYFYGNIIVNDENSPMGAASEPIHYGGDNYGEDGDTDPLITPETPYRSHLYFWGNTVVNRSSKDGVWNSRLFGLSQVNTTVDAWDNIFYFEGDSNFSLLEYTGTLNLRGNNAIYSASGSEVSDIRRDGTNIDRHQVNRIGTVIGENPQFENAAGGDYRLTAGSPVIDRATGVPSNILSDIPSDYHAMQYQPCLSSNGLVARTVKGRASDLGALERGVGDGIPSSPGIKVTPTSLTTTEPGGTATFSIVLESQPSANVTVSLKSTDLTEGTLSTDAIVFTPQNWNQTQEITVAGMDDDLVDGDIGYHIDFDSSVSDDPDYDGITLTPIGAINKDNDAPSPPLTGGTITYSIDHGSSGGGKKVYRIRAEKGATPEDISGVLDKRWPGSGDTALNCSPNGEWLILRSERFESDCNGWACLALLPKDLSDVEVVRTVSGSLLRTGAWAAVDNDGKEIIFSAGNGPHERDLWITRKVTNGWEEPVILTTDSPYQYNVHPSISNDGKKVVFEGGNDPYIKHSACEVQVDGTGFRIVLEVKKEVKGVRCPDYSPDDKSIILEVETSGLGGGEYIARVGGRQVSYKILNRSFANDNSPCVLPDGRIVSLWMGRPGGSGHELKVMTADGESYDIALENIDILDTGLGCGG